MRRILATLLILLSLSFSAPLSFALNDYSGFNVTEILSIEEGEADSAYVDGTENLAQTLKEDEQGPVIAILLRVINILTLLISTFAFVMIIIGGFMWSTSGGNESQIEKGKAVLLQAIFGLLIAFGSYFLVTFVLSFLY